AVHRPSSIMKEQLTITDLTRMQGSRICIAGYLPDDTCVRPVLFGSHLIERWLSQSGEVVIRPFAVVQFDFQESVPQPPHTEDRIIHPVYRERLRLLSPDEQQLLPERIKDPDLASIFAAAGTQAQ